jgi:protein tyrosine phosphatase (PTP) superfamily phosphohydrolase (DUF442 family)
MGKLEDIHNFLEISDWLSTAGQPKAEEFALLKTDGFAKVMNLALPTSTNALDNEAEIVKSLGMEYIHIPVIWDCPTLADFQKFAETLNQSLIDKSTGKVFIHCAMNMRVSVFVYLYRRIYQGTSHLEASQDLDKIWTPNPIWHEFIETTLTHS